MSKSYFLLILFILFISISLSAGDIKIQRVAADLDIKVGSSAADVTKFIKTKFMPQLVKINGLEPVLVKNIGSGGTSVFRYNYTYKGIIVENAVTTVAVKNGSIYRMTNSISGIDTDVTNLIPEKTAVKTAFSKQLGRNWAGELPKYYLEKRIIKHKGQFVAAYKIRFRPVSLADTRYYFVNAKTGEYISGGSDTKYFAGTDAEMPDGDTVTQTGTNMAKVFELNPKRTPDPIEVELPWVADDAGGFLTAAKDEKNVRLIVAANCPDKGEKVNSPYYGTFPICTPTQIANKYKNGSFTYEDWQKGLDFQFDINDVYPEVSMYYHSSKIYKYLKDLKMDGFSYLAGHNVGTANPNPLIVVANFQMPSSPTALSPMDNAFFSPSQPGFNDMFFADFPYQGDILVFGQGSKADFAYDGEVISHEFGHAVVQTVVAPESGAVADKYGYSMAPVAINEGIADSFSFIISGDPCLGEYASEGIASMAGYQKTGDFYCMRNADNEAKANEDFTGESHNDGIVAVGANWKVFQALLGKGLTRDDFTRLMIKVLVSITPQMPFKEYADIMVSEAGKDETTAAYAEEIKAIFTASAFFDEIRARNASKKISYLMSGGTDDTGGPVSYFVINVDGDDMKLAPAYVQMYYDMPECTNTISVRGNGQTDGNGGANPYYDLLVRKGQPIIYNYEDYPATAKFDKYVTRNDEGEYKLTGLEPKQKYYMHWVNKGGAGYITGISVTSSWEGAGNPCSAANDSDTIASDEGVPADADNATAGDADTAKNSAGNGGCSIIIN